MSGRINDASIRWGSQTSTTSFHRHGFDTKGKRFDLITIAGLYNHPEVPRFAIESVVCHEALHIIHPPYKKNGRTIYHGPAFREAERALPHYEQWRVWERCHAGRLIRSLRRTGGR
ncbi:MAG: hypothetical protein GF363_13020 [Chitinivibrionales bacterium]|nr:hypothetical protein [Chitinivibrionales bacterium]